MEAPSTYALRLERLIAAPRETVFRAWTEAATIVKWFAPGENFDCTVREADARAGGRLWIDMVSPDGQRHELRCTYEEVVPPERLTLRWRWESSPASGVSKVTVVLTEAEGGTQLVVVHEELPTPTSRASHEQGWLGGLARFVQQF